MRETLPRSADLSDANLMNIHHTRQKPCMTMDLMDKDMGDKSKTEENLKSSSYLLVRSRGKGRGLGVGFTTGL